MKILTYGLALMMTSAALAADSSHANVDGFTYQKSAGGVDAYVMDSNGLQVLLLPMKGAPVVTFMVTYHVGSRNEVTGSTGATHLLEHLMFKGTEKHDRGKGTGYDQILERLGAETNATTWLDRTNYYATVPKQALSILVGVEADRMRNLSLRESDRRPEMTVVRNEFERGDNDPVEFLSKEIWAAAFMAHPYHHPTIGWRSDIENVPIEKLRAFYDTFYWPNNATATLIGDFDPTEALGLIKQHYGPIPKSPQPFPPMYTTEPEQYGQRRVQITRTGEMGVVALAHKIPQGTHADWPAIDVLSAILTSGKTSRLYRNLTDQNLTVDVSGDSGFHLDPSLHIIDAELADGVKHEVVEKKIADEIAKIQKSGVTNEEVGNAVAGLLTKIAFHRDGSFELADQINDSIAVGDWTLFATMGDKLKAVTAADVQRVAKDYFQTNHSVAAWYVNTEGKQGAGGGGADEAGGGGHSSGPTKRAQSFDTKKVLPPVALEHPLAPPAATHFAASIQRSTVAGLDLLVCPTNVKEVVHLTGSLPAGDAHAANRALAELVAEMIQRGTKQRDEFAIADELEKVGASVEFKANTDTLDFTAKCLKKDVPLVLSIIAEELRTPAFKAADLTKVKTLLDSEAKQAQEDTEEEAAIAFAKALFPATHPAYPLDMPELRAAIKKATISDVRAFHAAHFGPTDFHLVAVGDVDPEAVKTAVAKVFDGWKPQSEPAINGKITGTATDKSADVRIPDKSSITVMLGQTTGLKAGDPDWLPLTIATDVLGHGFTSRLIGNVRDREGLTYSIGAQMGKDTYRPGYWLVEGSFAPALLEQGVASTHREIENWWKNGITEDELSYMKSALAGRYSISLETTDGLATQILRCVERGFPLSWLDEFPAKANAVTLEQVNASIKKYLDPAKMITVRAGTLP